MKEQSIILTIACRFTGQNHDDCTGRIYLGSVFGETNDCECACHREDGE